jgi:hypothetical protein
MLASAAALPARVYGLTFTNSYDGNRRIESCSDIRMMFWMTELGKDGTVTARRSQGLSLGSASKPLRVEAPNRGSVHVQPSMDGKFSALVCMAAGARSSDAAEAILNDLNVESRDGYLTVKGPDNDQWAATIVLSVPAGTSLDLSATNGGLQLTDVEGRFTLRTENGPIGMSHASGVVIAQTENGPVQFVGHAGDVRLTLQNGPLDVKLDAAQWSGKGLDASTQHGPITLTAPNHMKSGVQVTGSQGSPATWNGTALPMGQPGGSRTYRFGSDKTVVRLSTEGGPVDIKGPRRASRSVGI